MSQQTNIGQAALEQTFQEQLRSVIDVAKAETVEALSISLREVNRAIRGKDPARECADAADIESILFDLRFEAYCKVAEIDARLKSIERKELVIRTMYLQYLAQKQSKDGQSEGLGVSNG